MTGPPVERSQCVHQRRAKIADGDREQHEDNSATATVIEQHD